MLSDNPVLSWVVCAAMVYSYSEYQRWHKIAANGTGIYAVVAFSDPSVLVKDIKLNCKTKASNMHFSHHCMNAMLWAAFYRPYISYIVLKVSPSLSWSFQKSLIVYIISMVAFSGPN